MPTLAQVTRELLIAHNRYPRKDLGQHFLIDPKVVERIIAAAGLTRDDLVLEIGSGLGVVTAELAQHVYQLVAVEIDKELLGISREVLKPYPNISFVGQDILKVDLAGLTLGRKYKVVGNLPYYITAPIIDKLLTAQEKPELAVLMTQKEVAERMAAKPGSKSYGSFSVFCQFYAAVKIESLVSKSSFLPWPEVSSAIVSLTPHPQPLFPGLDEQKFLKIVHTAFQQRRKKLSTSLDELKLGETSIDLNRRPETLSVEEFALLARHFA
ncbi:MAG: 16S rRNA (adenine(1518)-N(6)/adenine(1519)-N(6))-dimethyltransferase RsmA [Candidatus Margulisbacteria bacterium]|jgi:16S rRNA (adenine1518-N6/adenine1519-N6)-dimethyltransferase|nr:16S rRNA (adenine(1518)-N(6)/adenine(1519)-N(6))-dimethyltransferase RsmA [Candidatus Margulisiibacteriota bacterium]